MTPQKLFRQPQFVPQIESQQHCQVKDCHQIQQNYQQPQLNLSQQYQNPQIQHQQVLQPQLSQCYHQQDLLQQPHSNMQILPFQQAYPKQCQSVSQSQIQHGSEMTQQQYQQQPQLLQNCPKDQHQQLGNVNDVQNAYTKQCQSGSQSQIQFGSLMTQQQHQQHPQLLQNCPKNQHQSYHSNNVLTTNILNNLYIQKGLCNLGKYI